MMRGTEIRGSPRLDRGRVMPDVAEAMPVPVLLPFGRESVRPREPVLSPGVVPLPAPVALSGPGPWFRAVLLLAPLPEAVLPFVSASLPEPVLVVVSSAGAVLRCCASFSCCVGGALMTGLRVVGCGRLVAEATQVARPAPISMAPAPLKTRTRP